MVTSILRRLSIVGLSLVLTAGLMVGCGSGNADSSSAQNSDKQVEKQSEKEHEHGHEESKHEEKGHHDEEGHEHGHDHGADHFEGKKAETYDEAVSNMKEANSKLSDLLADGKVSGSEFFKIHRMSYTMENALAKIREESDRDYSDVAKNLESVHLASEKKDAETVLQEGKKYLEGAKAMLEKE
jgi:hypothetical protein